MPNPKQSWTKFKNILRISLSLAKANFILRTEGSYLGIVWYLLNPLALFVIIFFIKQSAFSNTHIPDYPAYLLIGITGLNFFRQTITGSIKSISANADNIKSVNNIAPEILVLAVVFQSVMSHFFELVLVIGFLIYWHISLFGLLFYPFLLFFFTLLILGIAFIFATIGVYINDLDNIWSVFAQLLFLATPIFYVAQPGSAVYKFNLFNPLFYFLEIFRSLAIYSSLPPIWMMAVMIVLSLGLFAIGLLVFQRHKNKFAELV